MEGDWYSLTRQRSGLRYCIMIWWIVSVVWFGIFLAGGGTLVRFSTGVVEGKDAVAWLL